MGTSIISLQRQTVLSTLKDIGDNSWKVLVTDDQSRRILFAVASEDDVLSASITSIESLSARRQSQSDTDAVYLLSPLPHVLQTLERDLNDRRYRRAFLVWTSRLPNRMREVLYRSEARRAQISGDLNLNIDFYSQEAQLVTFREPWSFPILFNKQCGQMVSSHLDGLVQKLFSVCVSLGEYPIIRYYKPRSNYHAAGLCEEVARRVGDLLNRYADVPSHRFPPPSPRPRSILIITDRTMDLMAPLMHELTYQAMAMDLLPIRDINDKLSYRVVTGSGHADREEKDVEISEGDEMWSEHRHQHMESVLENLGKQFRDFMAKNKHLTDSEAKVSVNTLQDMLAGLPGFTKDKAAFSLHIDMASTCAEIFKNRLVELISVEQSLGTQCDENGKEPKNLVSQIVKLVDPEGPSSSEAKGTQAVLKLEERLRLLIMYVLYRGGTLKKDIALLLSHAGLRLRDESPDLEIFEGLGQLGVKIEKELWEKPMTLKPVFPYQKPDRKQGEEDFNQTIDRFKPAVAELLKQQQYGNLNTVTFPYLDQREAEAFVSTTAQGSLRTATGQPTWAKGRTVRPKQRIILFVAGGATYSESRECYLVPKDWEKEVLLVTSHMLTPSLFVQHLRELGRPPHELPLPKEPGVPAWVTERPSQGLPNGPNGKGPRPPVTGMQNMNLSTRPPDSRPSPQGHSPARAPIPSSQTNPVQHDEGKQKKEKKDKKHGFSSMFKKH